MGFKLTISIMMDRAAAAWVWLGGNGSDKVPKASAPEGSSKQQMAKWYRMR
jgi:hypothetical protein